MEYTNNGCLNLIIRTYYQDNSLSKDKNNKNYYLNWFRTTYLFVINNNRSIHEGVAFKLIRDCPNILSLCFSTNIQMIYSNTSNLCGTLWTNTKNKRCYVGVGTVIADSETLIVSPESFTFGVSLSGRNVSYSTSLPNRSALYK